MLFIVFQQIESNYVRLFCSDNSLSVLSLTTTWTDFYLETFITPKKSDGFSDTKMYKTKHRKTARVFCSKVRCRSKYVVMSLLLRVFYFRYIH